MYIGDGGLQDPTMAWKGSWRAKGASFQEEHSIAQPKQAAFPGNVGKESGTDGDESLFERVFANPCRKAGRDGSGQGGAEDRIESHGSQEVNELQRVH